MFDRLPRKAQYFAGDVDAQLPVTYKGLENYIFQQVMRVGASFLPHESGEEPKFNRQRLRLGRCSTSAGIGVQLQRNTHGYHNQ